MRIGILGGGVMGLSAGYYLSKQGYQVEIFEKEEYPGGLASSDYYNGMNIERYYHYICLPDIPYHNLIDELGLSNKLHWVKTKMGYFYANRLYPFSSPIDLLKFSPLSFSSRIRYGLSMFYVNFINNWRKIEKYTAEQWLKKIFGLEIYNKIWKRLLESKFEEYTRQISAAWMWTRIKRIGTSRKNLFTENLGYLDGGSNTLINALIKNIKKNKGYIHLNTSPNNLIIINNKIVGLSVKGNEYNFDKLISTIPLLALLKIGNSLPDSYKQKLKEMKNINVMCMRLHLKYSFSDKFWLNINDSRIEPITGIIEYTNIYPKNTFNKENILYIPEYLSCNNNRFNKSAQEILYEYIPYLKIINPNFNKDWIISYKLFKSNYAQPICTKRYSEFLPPIKTPVKNLFAADSAFVYPEDRSISESIRMGKVLSEYINKHN